MDIDTDDYSLDQLFDDTEIDSMWVKGNTTGYHVWVAFPNGKPDEYRKTEQNCSNLCTMNFLGEKVWERLGFTEEEGLAWSSNTIRYSQKYNLEENFNEDRFSTDWDLYDGDTNTATEGTIRYYANLSNPTY